MRKSSTGAEREREKHRMIKKINSRLADRE